MRPQRSELIPLSAMASPAPSQGTQDASLPELVAVDRGNLQLLLCSKHQATALAAVQALIQGTLGRRHSLASAHPALDACTRSLATHPGSACLSYRAPGVSC